MHRNPSTDSESRKAAQRGLSAFLEMRWFVAMLIPHRRSAVNL
jgi:hypothetical protein